MTPMILPLLFLLPTVAEVAQQHRAEKQLLIVDTAHYQMSFFVGGKLERTVEIGLGQGRGPKEELHDLKTPRGTYFIVDKQRGEFGGKWGEYFGGFWIKINYPGPDDAARGLSQGWLDEPTATRIRDAWKARKLTPQNTRLGGGVGFHGWASDWDGKGGAHLSFGCVVLHNADMAALFDKIAVGTMVVIL
jgi:L,D-transpeptidase catalytic domain